MGLGGYPAVSLSEAREKAALSPRVPSNRGSPFLPGQMTRCAPPGSSRKNVSSGHAMIESLSTARLHAVASLRAAVIRLDQLRALAALLSLDDVTEEFKGLTLPEQVSIFDLFEVGLGDVHAALTQDALEPTR